MNILTQLSKIFRYPRVKILVKFFLIFFLLFVIAINYKYLARAISYLNYRVLSSTFHINFKSHLPSFLLDSSNSLAENQKNELSGTLTITKIQVHAPVIFTGNDTDTNPLHLKSYLERGVLFYPGSALPSENGQTVILGHSAPDNWPKIKYDTVFSELNRLANGDEINLEVRGKNFVYKVTERVFLARGDEIPNFALTNGGNVLVLVSCWPPGKDYKRIAVAAVME